MHSLSLAVALTGVPGVFLERFHPGSGSWSRRAILGAAPVLTGNMGTTHAVDFSARVLYGLVEAPANGDDGPTRLAQVDIDTAALVRQPELGPPGPGHFTFLMTVGWLP